MRIIEKDPFRTARSLAISASLLALLISPTLALAACDPNAEESCDPGPETMTSPDNFQKDTGSTEKVIPPEVQKLSEPTATKPIDLVNPLGKVTDVRVVIARFVQMITGISGSLALAVFVWGGFNWVIAAGDETRIKTGKNSLKYGTIGLIIIFGSYAALNILFRLLGQAAA